MSGIREIDVGLSLMIEQDFLNATLPLFERELVDVIEWSVDLGWRAQGLPSWTTELLADYSQRKKLHAHGVHFSALSAAWQPEKDTWLQHLAREVKTREYGLVSEHFGFSTVPGVRHGAPFPVPYCEGALAVGRANLAKIKAITHRPIGLENLALAFSEHDVWAQGAFLESLLAPLDGFLVLDVHNLHCQIQNFGCDAAELLSTYPLARARIIHVSGGSWADASYGKIRQDTHDGEVPDEVFGLVRDVIARAPNVEAVIFERLGGTIRDPRAANRLRADYEKLRRVVAEAAVIATRNTAIFSADRKPPTPTAHDEHALAIYQTTLLDALCAGEKSAPQFGTTLSAWSETTSTYETRMLALGARIANSYTVKD